MKALWNTNNNLHNRDEEKAEGLIRAHFVWNECGRTTEEEEEESDSGEVEESSLEAMITKVEIALSGTQNSSTPGPDGISYRFIKTIKGMNSEERLLEEVARKIIKGIIPRE